MSANTALTTLDCSHNALTTLDIRNNTALTSLKCQDNPALKTIYVWAGFDPDKQFTTLQKPDGAEWARLE